MIAKIRRDFGGTSRSTMSHEVLHRKMARRELRLDQVRVCVEWLRSTSARMSQPSSSSLVRERHSRQQADHRSLGWS